MKNIIQRFKAQTPDFFKKLQKIAASISAISITAQNALTQYLPAYAITILQHCTVCGILAIVLAQLTKTDSNQEVK